MYIKASGVSTSTAAAHLSGRAVQGFLDRGELRADELLLSQLLSGLLQVLARLLQPETSNHMYSSTALTQSRYHYMPFILLLHHISEVNNVLFTPLHLSDSFSSRSDDWRQDSHVIEYEAQL